MNNKAILCGFAVFCVAMMVATCFLCLNDGNTQTDSFDASAVGEAQVDLGDGLEDGILTSDGGEPGVASAAAWIGCLRYYFDDDTRTACVQGRDTSYADSEGCLHISVPDSVWHDGKEYVVNRIGKGALHNMIGCSTYTLEIGENIEVIDNYALEVLCSSDAHMTSFTIRNIEDSKLREIGCYAFWNQLYLTSVELPESLQTIGNSAFRNCQALQEVILHSASLEIGESAFRGDRNLAVIDLSNVTALGNGAFHDCKSLTYADLSSIQSIAQTTFRSCPLTYVVIGGSLQTIRADSFYTVTFCDVDGNAIDVNVENLRGRMFVSGNGDGALRATS